MKVKSDICIIWFHFFMPKNNGYYHCTVIQWSLTSWLINWIQKYAQNFDRKLRTRNLISHFDICNMIYYYCSTWSRFTRFCRRAWLTRPDTKLHSNTLHNCQLQLGLKLELSCDQDWNWSPVQLPGTGMVTVFGIDTITI